MKHALSVDVEDYFQVLNMAHKIDRQEWDRIQLRCGDSTRRILELLARRDAKATFFFLGWIAERMPELVLEVRDAGHEIGSHGYDHRVLPDLGAEGFRKDLRQTNEILRGILGEVPTQFRACTWSITDKTPWALPILREEGFALDSSIFPIRHPDYGDPSASLVPYRIPNGDGRGGDFWEFPPLTMEVLGRRLPVGGGGYLRLFPLKLVKMGLKQQENRGYPGCIYLHPWEVDPEQPRVKIGGVRGFRHYVNLRRTLTKLDRLLQFRAFVGLRAALDAAPKSALSAEKAGAD